MNPMERLPVVYVAGPYRASTRAGVELNIQSARQVGLVASRKGWSAIVPHANTGHLDAVDPDIGDDFWLAATMELLRRSDAVVLCPGWERSTGTLAEINVAKSLGMTVYESADQLPAVDEAAEASTVRRFTLKIGESYTITNLTSLDDASREYQRLRDASGLSASAFPDGEVSGGYRISYNGRVWKDGVMVREAAPRRSGVAG